MTAVAADLTDVRSAAELIQFGLARRVRPVEGSEYRVLLDRYRDELRFKDVVDTMAEGLGLEVLGTPRAGIVLVPEPGGPFATRLGDLRTMDQQEKLVFGLVLVGIAAYAYPNDVDFDDPETRLIDVPAIETFLRTAAVASRRPERCRGAGPRGGGDLRRPARAGADQHRAPRPRMHVARGGGGVRLAGRAGRRPRGHVTGPGHVPPHRPLPAARRRQRGHRRAGRAPHRPRCAGPGRGVMSRAPVMWQIRRIRLDHVGPAAARFLDVTLDFTDDVRHPARHDPVAAQRRREVDRAVAGLRADPAAPPRLPRHRRHRQAPRGLRAGLRHRARRRGVVGPGRPHARHGRRLRVGRAHASPPTRRATTTGSRRAGTPSRRRPGRAELDLLPFTTRDKADAAAGVRRRRSGRGTPSRLRCRGHRRHGPLALDAGRPGARSRRSSRRSCR